MRNGGDAVELADVQAERVMGGVAVLQVDLAGERAVRISLLRKAVSHRPKS